MKQVQRNLKTNIVVPKNQAQTAHQAQKYTRNEAYLQINRTSFQQNFKFLIGHYKEDGQISRTE